MISERTKMLGSLDAVHTHTHTHQYSYKRIGGQSGERRILYSTWELSTLQSNLIKINKGRDTFICNIKKADYK